jgi:RNA polymerase sigma-70 factor (ECF subfamily)
MRTMPIDNQRLSDPDCWAGLYGQRLTRYALSRLRDSQAAEDLVQETFLTAFKSRARFRGDSAELTWMTGILRNKIFEHFRRQTRESFVYSAWADDAGSACVEPAPEETAETTEFAFAVRDCLAGLSPNSARIFALRGIDGLSNIEASMAMRSSPNYVAVLFCRTRAHLRRELEAGYLAASVALRS